MSDLQDLIHKTSMDCLAKGKQQEQERIIKLLNEHEDNWRCREGCCEGFGWDGDNPINQITLLTTLIKGEK